MGILDSAGLKKLQENFLSKGDQNGITGLNLGRVIVIAKYENSLITSKRLAAYIGWIEDEQMKIGGRSRKEFAESLKNMPVETSNTFGTVGKK